MLSGGSCGTYKNPVSSFLLELTNYHISQDSVLCHNLKTVVMNKDYEGLELIRGSGHGPLQPDIYFSCLCGFRWSPTIDLIFLNLQNLPESLVHYYIKVELESQSNQCDINHHSTVVLHSWNVRT